MKFVDYHAHAYGTGYKVLNPKLDGLALEAVLDVVRKQAERLTPDQWLLLRGWDQNLWEGKRFPTKDMLNAIRSDVPIVLVRIDGHTLWCNSRALELSGITHDTVSPPGGEIQRDTHREPTGIIIDEAMQLVYDAMPKEDEASIIRTLRAGLEHFGIHHVGMHDMGIPAEWWEPYKKLYATSGDALVKANVFLDMNKPTGRKLFLERLNDENFCDSPHENLTLVGIKIYLDGALGSRGAHLFEDYADDPGNRGLRLMEDAEALELMFLAAARGLQIAIHAIGDAANARALDLIEQTQNTIPPYPHTPIPPVYRVEHAQVVRDIDLPRFKQLGVWAIIQPQFYSSDHLWALERLGAERM
jgi:predicted amidohydrolase YtcJ